MEGNFPGVRLRSLRGKVERWKAIRGERGGRERRDW